MKVKMIRDTGVFKKNEIYEVEPRKSIELLTTGFCVRISRLDEKPRKKNGELQPKTKKPKLLISESKDVL